MTLCKNLARKASFLGTYWNALPSGNSVFAKRSDSKFCRNDTPSTGNGKNKHSSEQGRERISVPIFKTKVRPLVAKDGVSPSFIFATQIIHSELETQLKQYLILTIFNIIVDQIGLMRASSRVVYDRQADIQSGQETSTFLRGRTVRWSSLWFEVGVLPFCFSQLFTTPDFLIEPFCSVDPSNILIEISLDLVLLESHWRRWLRYANAVPKFVPRYTVNSNITRCTYSAQHCSWYQVHCYACDACAMQR